MTLTSVVSGEQAIAYSGLVRKHAEGFARLCEMLGWYVIFRGVNPDATLLIADNYPTKDMGVHGKSSDWGPQAGFICLNQLFSKVVKYGSAAVEKANKESPMSIEHGYPAVPLLVSEKSLDSLKGRGKISSYQVNGNQGSAISSIPESGVQHQFALLQANDETIEDIASDLDALSFETATGTHKNPIRGKEDLCAYLRNLTSTIASLARKGGESRGGEFDHLFFVRSDSRPAGYPGWYRGPYGQTLFVLASSGAGRYSREAARRGCTAFDSQGSGPFQLPLTADYDLFAICPPLIHLTVQQPSFASDKRRRLAEAIHRVRNARSHTRRLLQMEEFGDLTKYHLYALLMLNIEAKKMGYRGGFVCHHGTEQENIHYYEVDPIYTIISPGCKIYAAPPHLLEQILAEIEYLGFVYYPNPTYATEKSAYDSPGLFAKNGEGRISFGKRYESLLDKGGWNDKVPAQQGKHVLQHLKGEQSVREILENDSLPNFMVGDDAGLYAMKAVIQEWLPLVRQARSSH